MHSCPRRYAKAARVSQCARQRCAIKIEPRERGDAQTGAVYLRYASLLGLVERWAMAPLEQTVRVYPALRQGEDQEIFLARGRQIDMQLRRRNERGLGRDFESLREYLDGDDLRDVCWTATARRGQIDHAALSNRTQPGSMDRARCGKAAAAAESCQIPAILTVAGTPSSTTPAPRRWRWRNWLCYSGDRVGLLVYGQHMQQRVLPGRGPAHLRQIVEALAQARAEASEADHLRATATLNRWQPRRALILWITDLAETAMRPEVIDGAMQLLHRHVLLFVAMAQPDVEAHRQRAAEKCGSRCFALRLRRS